MQANVYIHECINIFIRIPWRQYYASYVIVIFYFNNYLALILNDCEITEGKATSSKEKIESIDDENKTIKYSLFDGEVSENYKSLKAILQVFDKDNGGIVKWTFEYEKLKEDIATSTPDAYLDFANKVTREIDAHFSKE